MKKILVTGCNGQLGRAIRAEYAQEEVTFINTDVVEGEGVTALDIADVDAVLALVRAERPQAVSYTHLKCLWQKRGGHARIKRNQMTGGEREM